MNKYILICLLALPGMASGQDSCQPCRDDSQTDKIAKGLVLAAKIGLLIYISRSIYLEVESSDDIVMPSFGIKFD